MKVTKGQALYSKARKLIPGGTQLLSKRPEMFLPDQWPSYYRKAKGVEIWDLDGNKFIDASITGVGSTVLGYADPDVEKAVIAAVRSGSMSTLNCPEEVELAELLIQIHPWAEMVRYARTGGEMLSVAIRIARAATARERVAFCGYHGWSDWYLAANLSADGALDGHLLPGLPPNGVPRGLSGTMHPFRFSNREDFEKIVSENGTQLAAVIMEPARTAEPDQDFLKHVRAVTERLGAVLIFDEVTAGWRMNTGGIHMITRTRPDMAVFAKGMSNGYPMAAAIGRRAVMEAAQKSFISSTYWTEKIGPAAALATIRKHAKKKVPAHLIKIGRMIQAGWMEAAGECGLEIEVGGIPPLSGFRFPHKDAPALSTLFVQEMLARGFLAKTHFYVCYAHSEEKVRRYLKAVRDVFAILKQAADRGDAARRLRGPVQHSGFQRLA